MAFPTIYVDTGGAATNSGSTDNNTALVGGTAGACNPSSTTVDLSGDAPDLSGVATDGTATIYLSGATNSNRKIFRITAVDNGLKTVTVDTAPTGNFTGATWNIGGRLLLNDTSRAYIEGAQAGGWTFVLNNNPGSSASPVITMRNSGTVADGFITVRGKSGAKRVLTSSSTTACISGSGVNYWKFENIEVVQTGASGSAIIVGGGCVFDDIKVSDAGGTAIRSTAGNLTVLRSEVGGGSIVAGISSDAGANNITAIGNYIHDVSGDGIVVNGDRATVNAAFNVIDSCGGRGIYLQGAWAAGVIEAMMIVNNTIYGCGNSGLESVDADVRLVLENNIFAENGNAAGEYNVECLGQAIELISHHGYNCFFHSGGGGGANLSGLTANSTEITSDPLFTDAANGDFSLQSGSPCKATAFPGVLLGGATGYLDMGAVQRQEPAGSGGGARIIGG